MVANLTAKDGKSMVAIDRAGEGGRGEGQKSFDEKAYKDSLARIPSNGQKVNPWAKVRECLTVVPVMPCYWERPPCARPCIAGRPLPGQPGA
jgi:hypothetical protein